MCIRDRAQAAADVHLHVSPRLASGSVCHDADTDTDTDILSTVLATMSLSVSVSVSASWNASYSRHMGPLYLYVSAVAQR